MKKTLFVSAAAVALTGCIATLPVTPAFSTAPPPEKPVATPSPAVVAKPATSNVTAESAAKPNLDGQLLRVKTRSVSSTPNIDGPTIFAEYLKKLAKSKGSDAKEQEVALVSDVNGLARLFRDPSDIHDTFERKRAEAAHKSALAGLGGKFIAKYGRPVNTFKFHYTGPVWFEDYDFNTGEILLRLCASAMDRFTDAKIRSYSKYYENAIYAFGCSKNQVYAQDFSVNNSLVNAVKDLNLNLSMSPQAYQQEYLAKPYLAMLGTELRIKVSPADAEKLKKKGTFSQKTHVDKGASNAWGSNLYSFFTANIDLAFDDVKAAMLRINSSNLFPKTITVYIKPIKVCLEDIRTDEKYLCGTPRSAPK